MNWIKYGTEVPTIMEDGKVEMVTETIPIAMKPILIWGSVSPFGATFHRGFMDTDHMYWVVSQHPDGTVRHCPIEYPEFWMNVEAPEG